LQGGLDVGKKNVQVKHLWGQEFTIANDGLDETEVSSFVGQLIQQNKEYAARQEHLNSLRMLAEKTVIEAEKQAQHVMVESQEKANRAAEATIKEAEVKARQEANGIIIEAQEKAKADANTIISEATKEAERLQQKAQAILGEMEETARLKLAQTEQQTSEILGTARTEADNLKTAARATADSMILQSQNEIDNILTQAKEEASEIRKQAARELQISKRKMAQAFINSQNTAERQIKETITRIYEGALSALATEATTDTPLMAEEAGKTPAATLEHANHSTIADSPKEELSKAPESELEAPTTEYQAEPTENSTEKTDAGVPKADQSLDEEIEGEYDRNIPPLYEGNIEIEVLNELTLDVVLRLHKYLKEIPGVEALHLKRVADDVLTIELNVGHAIPLITLLEKFPEVESITEHKDNNVNKAESSQRKAGHGGGKITMRMGSPHGVKQNPTKQPMLRRI
jgi:hypothetical protein